MDTANTLTELNALHYTGQHHINYLSEKNAHPRDEFISFDEGPHIYTISLPGQEPTTKYTSVTTWVHHHFEEFDADKIIDNMMKSPKWTKNKYYPMTKEEILAAWEKNRDEAATAGTNMHYDIECFYNDAPFDEPARLESDEFQYFIQFERLLQSGKFGNLVPFRTEWTVFDEDAELSGSIDMIYYKPDTNTYAIYDWKRCRKIQKSPAFNKWSKTECIQHLPDTNYWHYTLQLNTYRNILQRKYGVVVDELYLVSLHPNQKSFKRWEVPMLDNEITMLFDEYMDSKE